MRAFCSNSQPKQKKQKLVQKLHDPLKKKEIKANPEDKMIEKNKIRTYTLKKPENQVLARHEPPKNQETKRESVSEREDRKNIEK